MELFRSAKTLEWESLPPPGHALGARHLLPALLSGDAAKGLAGP
jgi:hypothetical protein